MFLAVSNDGYKQRDDINKRYLNLQSQHYTYLKERNEDIRKFKHDMTGHMLTIRKLCNDKDYKELDRYMENVGEKLHIDDVRVSVSNGIVDAIIKQSMYESKKVGVQLNVEGIYMMIV